MVSPAVPTPPQQQHQPTTIDANHLRHPLGALVSTHQTFLTTEIIDLSPHEDDDDDDDKESMPPQSALENHPHQQFMMTMTTDTTVPWSSLQIATAAAGQRQLISATQVSCDDDDDDVMMRAPKQLTGAKRSLIEMMMVPQRASI